MLRILGAVLLLISGAMIGLYQSMRLASRPRQIRQLSLALQRLETEILYGSTPLPEALRSASIPLSYPVSNLFLDAAQGMSSITSGVSAAESWNKAITQGWKLTFMKDPEREALHQFGSTLGISDAEDQVKHIRLAISHLLIEERNAIEDEKQYGKLWRSLSILGSALIVVIMF
ncbi:MAG: stage III sporulation protein AB [Gorillibacterium sp.]|nr:stage III sporulation protein AB [Gorillibacterium sp.]